MDEARAIIGRLLEMLQIDRIVYVDDIFAQDRARYSFESVVEPLFFALPNASESIHEFPQPYDYEQWQEIYTGLPESRQREICEMVGVWREPAIVSSIASIFPEGMVHSCTFQEFGAQKSGFYANKHSRERTLFFFDEDASEFESPLRSDEGRYLLKEAVSHNCWYVGLVSHNYAIETEPGKLKELLTQFPNEINLHRTAIPISKRYIPDAPQAFVRLLILALMASSRDQFIRTLCKGIQGAATIALKEVNEIDAFDLQDMVFNRSRTEGIWEGETFLRLFTIHQRDSLRRKALTNTTLKSALARIRELQNIQAELAAVATPAPNRPIQPPPPQPALLTREITWLLQQKERYEPAGQLSRYHFATDLGDIFETSDGKRFILLAPPCDLMVREGGSRVSEAVLVPLVQHASHQSGNQFYAVQYMDMAEAINSKREHKHHWWAEYKNAFAVNLTVLDLCVFQKDGSAKYRMNENAPHGLTPGWKKRFTEIEAEFNAAVQLYTTALSGIRRSNMDLLEGALARGFLPQLSIGNDLAAKIEKVRRKWQVTYDLKRTGRLRMPYSLALLNNYTAFLTRPAFDMDLK